MPTIAIDYTPAYEQGGGIGRYVRELVTALACLNSNDTYRLFVSGLRSDTPLPPPPGPGFSWRATSMTPRTLARVWHRARIPLPVEAFTGMVSLFHATDFVLPPTLPHTRTLLTVHDLSFVRVPESAAPPLKAYLDRVVPRSAHRADHILADSEATRRDLIELYSLPTDKITTLLSGVDAHFRPVDTQASQQVRAKYALGSWEYVLSVGTVQPRKNYVRLITALSILRSRGLDLQLVIAGGRGWLEDPIHDAVRSTGLQPFVHFIGFADDADLPALYSSAAAFAFPSLYEGFGLPVLEAMACGTPVVTSDVSSLPEVAGDAALTVNPLDVDAIADAIERVIIDSDLRRELVSRGQKRATAFTWDTAAQRLQSVYEALLT